MPNSHSGAAPQPPAWMHRAAPHAPGRRARMLAHMTRARSLPQRPAAAAQPKTQPRTSSPLAAGMTIFGDACGYAILFGLIALLFQSSVPLYLGTFLFLGDGTRLERALGSIGIRFVPDTIGPEIVKGSVFWFAWIALLVSMRSSVPGVLAAWMPPAASWFWIAGIALALAIFDALAALTIRRAGPWFNLSIRPDGLAWTTIKTVVLVGVLVLLGLV